MTQQLMKHAVPVEEHKALRASAVGGYRQLENPYMRPVAMRRDGQVIGYVAGLFGDGVRGPQWLSARLLAEPDLASFPALVAEIIQFVQNSDRLPANISPVLVGGQ